MCVFECEHVCVPVKASEQEISRVGLRVKKRGVLRRQECRETVKAYLRDQ